MACAGHLLELRIKDFAIVDELTLALEPGLNALTGETGAGKSILIDALGAVLGDRVSPAVVRAGAARALVEATFSRPSELPQELELDPADDVVILSREIGANARGAARINGRTVPISLLQVAGRALVDVHGQSDHQSLLRPATHLHFLDRFGGLDGQRRQLASVVADLREIRQQIARLQGDAREMVRRQDLLRFQVEEIDGAALQPGEEEILTSRRTTLANAEKLRELVSQALSALNEDGQAIDAASAAAKLLGDAARLDPALAGDAAGAEEAIVRLQDVSRELAKYVDGLEADPDELQRIEDRLDLLRGLRRKYGEAIQEVLAFADNARAQLAELQGADEHIATLQAGQGRLQDEVRQMAGRLSEARRQAATDLTAAVEGQLDELNMAGALFTVGLQRRADGEDVQPNGVDEVEFLLAANRGEPVRPLAHVASGGEASRLMLALKSAFSEVDDTPVLVFDEIEVGVGARGGHVIGHKLRQLARQHQVLCITHLAPVAALADAHFQVRKLTTDERTSTTVDRLDGEKRVDELAEMLAGRPIGEAARASAQDLLSAANIPA